MEKGYVNRLVITLEFWTLREKKLNSAILQSEYGKRNHSFSWISRNIPRAMTSGKILNKIRVSCSILTIRLEVSVPYDLAVDGNWLMLERNIFTVPSFSVCGQIYLYTQ